MWVGCVFGLSVYVSDVKIGSFSINFDRQPLTWIVGSVCWVVRCVWGVFGCVGVCVCISNVPSQWMAI